MNRKAVIIILSLCAAIALCAAGLVGYQIGQKHGGLEPHSSVIKPSDRAEGFTLGNANLITIPGFDHVRFKAGQKRQSITLYNPMENDCAFVISLILPSGKEVYRSTELKPGDTIEQIEISEPLHSTIYEESILRYSCYSLDGQKELGGADTIFTLEVLP